MYSEITTSKILGSVADPQTAPLGIDECVISKLVSLIAIDIILYAIIEDIYNIVIDSILYVLQYTTKYVLGNLPL